MCLSAVRGSNSTVIAVCVSGFLCCATVCFLCQVSSLCLDQSGQSGSPLSTLWPNTHIYQNRAQQQTESSQGRGVLGIGAKGRLDKNREVYIQENRNKGGTENWKTRDCWTGGGWIEADSAFLVKRGDKGQCVTETTTPTSAEKTGIFTEVLDLIEEHKQPGRREGGGSRAKVQCN